MSVDIAVPELAVTDTRHYQMFFAVLQDVPFQFVDLEPQNAHF